jgi:hypothetical protein
LTTFEDEIKQTNITIANKCHIQTKLEDEIEQYRIKILRADHFVCSKNIEIVRCCFIYVILILDQTFSTNH